MEPYRTDRPKVYADMPNSLTALLGRLADAGIPLTHTLYEYAMNPDAPVTETAQNLTDEFVPFKYQIRSGEATPSSLAKEAILMFSPQKGGRRAVRKNPDGTFNSRDLGAWMDQKETQRIRVADKIKERDPSGIIPELENQLDITRNDINSMNELLAMDLDPTKRKEITNDLIKYQKREAELRNEINKTAIDALGYNGRRLDDFWNNYVEDDFIDRALRREGVTDIDKAKSDAGLSNVMHNFKAPEY